MGNRIIDKGLNHSFQFRIERELDKGKTNRLRDWVDGKNGLKLRLRIDRHKNGTFEKQQAVI